MRTSLDTDEYHALPPEQRADVDEWIRSEIDSGFLRAPGLGLGIRGIAVHGEGRVVLDRIDFVRSNTRDGIVTFLDERTVRTPPPFLRFST